MEHTQKKLYIFDVDGTVAEPYASIHEGIAELWAELLKQGAQVGVLSARGTQSVMEHVVAELPCKECDLENVLLGPNAGAELLEYKNDTWTSVHKHAMTDELVKELTDAFYALVNDLADEIGGSDVLDPDVVNKDNLLVSLTVIKPGNDPKVRSSWDPDKKHRAVMARKLDEQFPHLQFRIGGSTTIDVMQEGITKAFGLQCMLDHLGVSVENAVFFGDALFPGGNDWDVIETGVDTISVTDPEDCFLKLQSIVAERS